MTYSPALALLVRVVATGGARTVGSSSHGDVGALASVLVHPDVIVAACCIVVFGSTCAAILVYAAAYATRWLRRDAGGERLRGLTFGRGAWRREARTEADESSRPVHAADFALQAATTERALRVLESTSLTSPASDRAWQAFSEDIPHVGRVEWDAHTLRTFACQPEVLYRLAFYRWRLELGKLSEFGPLSTAAGGMPVVETGEAIQRAGRAPEHVAPSPEEQRTLWHGQHASEQV